MWEITIEADVEASLGMSRKWDAREAGKEVARDAIQKLNSPPCFFLLFSTIHYEKYGGFEEFLNGVWEVLPEGTPLVGGTVTGFVNNYGCYSRGATALAVSYPEMDVALGLGKNTKRNPKKAAKQCAEMIRKNLDDSQYKNKFLLNLISGPEVPSMPGIGRKKIIESGFVSKFAMQAIGISQVLLQKGVGREDEIFEEMVEKLPNYSMVMGTLMDDYRGLINYQFFNDKILTNHTVNLGIATDLNLDVCTSHGMKKTDVNFEITKLSKNKRIVHQLNNKPAVPELLRLLGWPKEFLNDKTMAHTILYYPISLTKKGRSIPVIMPFMLKNSILMPCVLDKGPSSILTTSGRNLVDAMNENLEFFSNIEPEFGVCASCMTILQTLGYKIDIVREELLEYFKEKPFLMFYCAGEGSYSPTENINYANMSFNTAVFGH